MSLSWYDRMGDLERAEPLPSSAVCFQEVIKLSKPTTEETGSVASASLPSAWANPHLKEGILPQLRLGPCSQVLQAAQEMILLVLRVKEIGLHFARDKCMKLTFDFDFHVLTHTHTHTLNN